MDTLNIVPIVQALNGTISAIKLYALTHPQTQVFMDKLFQAILDALITDTSIHLDLIEDDFTCDGLPLIGLGNQGDALIALFKRKHIARLGFARGITREALENFVIHLAKADDTMPVVTASIYYGQLSSGSDSSPGSSDWGAASSNWVENSNENSPSPQGYSHARTQQEQYSDDLRLLYQSISKQQQVKAAVSESLVMAFLKTFNQSANPLAFLADIKTEDEYTYVHTINVAVLTMALAKQIGFSSSNLVDVTYAALMHDAGKMLVPAEILNKPGALNAEELAIMRSHPVLGAQHIAKQTQLPQLTILAALEHHIRFDGGGYPNLGPNWKPHIVSQMISVSDIYDALRSRRPYREPLKPSEIAATLTKESGLSLNPQLVDVFLKMIHKEEPR